MIIGLTGTNSAGKGTVVEYLCQQKGFHHFSARAFIAQEIEKQGLAPTRDTMITIANRMRVEHGPDYILESLYQQAKEVGGNAILESIRGTAEVEALRNHGDFILIAVDAPIELRYQRALNRKSSTDHMTFEEFKDIEDREMFNATNDPYAQNLKGVIEMADSILMNTGTPEELFEQVEEVLNTAKTK
ncbi:AAA family ATPase [Candidatus Nomurabacteria bacterium]|nr:AAA family ATPase [Candidatus Nomurabacteria bacterium]